MVDEAKEWVEQNIGSFKEKVNLPLFYNMDAKDKEDNMFSLIKSCVGKLSDDEQNQLRANMSFCFNSKDDFIFFNKAMLEKKLDVDSSFNGEP